MERLIHNAKRLGRIAAGVVLLGGGLVLAVPGVPGPGLLLVFLGLSVLALDFVWARRLKRRIEETAKEAVEKVRGRKGS